LLEKVNVITFFFGFCTGLRPIKDGRLIRLVRRGMHTGLMMWIWICVESLKLDDF
jgi:hypothetical protein